MNPTFFESLIAYRTSLWNALIPQRATRVEMNEAVRAVRYLHPTKGWRYVSFRRLGLA